jgi:alanine racemase
MSVETKQLTSAQHWTWAEIDLKALAYNFEELKKLAKKNMAHHAGIMPVIKADAYGHGMLQVAKILDELGCKMFAVSNVLEGIALREGGFKQKVLTFESTLPSDATALVDHNLTPTVCNRELAQSLEDYAAKCGKEVFIHIKVDTGMGRLGLDEAEALSFLEFVRKECPHLKVEGVFTHFPVADTDREFTINQMRRFRDIVYVLENNFFTFTYIHAGNSMGLGDYKSELFNLARPGLMLYGVYPSHTLVEKIRLKPVMAIKAKIIFVKTIAKGKGVSYGHTFKAKEDMTIAVLPIGYSNGYMRSLSNNAFALVGGVRCPVIGRVTMDQIMVDITPLGMTGKLPKIGDEAVLIGNQKDSHISADEIADWAGTISYEILCSLGSRLPRRYHE